jgi:hypothetical protein
LLGHMKPADADTHYMLIQPTAKNICFDPSQLDTKKALPAAMRPLLSGKDAKT